MKIKIKSLAEEARVIRFEELKMKALGRKADFEMLQAHRRHVVRPAARHAQLAYAFIRGREYRRVEQKVHAGNEPNWKAVAKNLAAFTDLDVESAKQAVKVWSEKVLEGVDFST